ncbi:transposase family protein [Actinomadura sp. 7K507]|uniref:transposase family protein n=1 Tax=Actinomadura sp. 7K507 TaxID=2530365 RepID=UPI001049613E|nr:transposase family protein [Actinomadura sp. 7K507]TDC89575.1 IS5/IS1182 family transposase [Actinomadura sp. 7K507]
MLFYRAALDLSSSTRTFVADLIAGHRHRIGSRWRALPPGRQALLVLVHLRCNETFERLAAAFGVGVATAHRYVTEVVALLTELAPDLREAMRIAQRKAFVILDGTLAPTDRLSGAGDRLHYSGKHHRHGVNIQFLTDPHGRLIWASPALPGSTHDLTAARAHGIIDALTSRAIACYADKAYVGAGGAIGTPYKRRKRRKLGKRKKLFNRHHARVRALGEQGAATLKRWHILRKARCSPSRLTAIVQAILTLHHQAA